MTGSGTQNDPYICSTWAELQSVTGATAQNYIQMAEVPAQQKIIDFLEIQPDGFAETVYLHGFIDFNGWTLKNFYSASPTTAISIGGHMSGGSDRGGGMLKNLKMKNFFHIANSPSTTQLPIRFLSYTAAANDIEIINCTFTGELNYNNILPSGAVVYAESFISYNGSPYDSEHIKISNSAFNVKANCNRGLVILGIEEIEKCRMKLDVSAPAIILITGITTNARYLQRVNNCHFSGFLNDTSTVTHNIVVSGELSSYNVYDIESNALLEYKGGGVSVFNNQKATPTAYDNIFVGLTTAQLQSDTALINAGFPCEVVQNGNN